MANSSPFFIKIFFSKVGSNISKLTENKQFFNMICNSGLFCNKLVWINVDNEVDSDSIKWSFSTPVISFAEAKYNTCKDYVVVEEVFIVERRSCLKKFIKKNVPFFFIQI